MARENGVLTQRWVNGNLVTEVIGGRAFTLYVDNVSAACRDYAMRHGLKQRTGDACAIQRRTPDGYVRSDEEMLALREARLQAIVDHLNSGAETWELRSGGGGAPDAGLIVMGIMRWKGCDVDTANRYVDRLAEKRGITRREALGEFAKSDQVAAAIAAIRAERATVSSDELLDELESA